MSRLLLPCLLAWASLLPAALVEGNPAAAVRVVIYEDLQCSDCAAFRRMLDEKLLPKYKDKVAFEHRDFPLPRHAWARPAAVASRFFETIRPSLAVEFRRHALENIKATSAANFPERLAAFARAHGADPEKALAALSDKMFAAAVEEDYQEGVARGVSRTPTAFVNGRPFVETFTFEEIAQAIDGELKH